MTRLRLTLALIGHGMVGHCLVRAVLDRGLTECWDAIGFAQEPRAANDPVSVPTIDVHAVDGVVLSPPLRTAPNG